MVAQAPGFLSGLLPCLLSFPLDITTHTVLGTWHALSHFWAFVSALPDENRPICYINAGVNEPNWTCIRHNLPLLLDFPGLKQPPPALYKGLFCPQCQLEPRRSGAV